MSGTASFRLNRYRPNPPELLFEIKHVAHGVALHQLIGMTAAYFEARIIKWAQQQPGLEALVLGGSRSQQGDAIDEWSDWDFQIISRCPQIYHEAGWVGEIAPCWCAHSERTPRGVVKVSAIFENGLEADFVPLAAWQMKLVYLGMRYPQWTSIMPPKLVRGIQETRAFMLGSGYRLVVGGESWRHRLEALKVSWPARAMSAREFTALVAAFWQKAVWVFKKITRPEPRSAMHWLHLLVIYQVYALLEEEARLAGKAPRPEARKAERWLDAGRLSQTAIETSIDQALLAKTLLSQIALFNEVSRNVASARGFPLADYSGLERWLCSELAKLER